MEQDYRKPSSGMEGCLRRFQHARAVLRAVESRTRVRRESATDKPGDVLERLRANQNVRVAVAKLIDGGTRE